MEQLQKTVKEFIGWCRPRLGLEGRIRVILVNSDINHGGQNTFGYYDPQDKCIHVCVKDRHPIDVLRTLSHELVHRAQAQHQPLTGEDGATGSDIENEANALAGILMRLWNHDSRK